jgi:hypothetical protein
MEQFMDLRQLVFRMSFAVGSVALLSLAACSPGVGHVNLPGIERSVFPALSVETPVSGGGLHLVGASPLVFGYAIGAMETSIDSQQTVSRVKYEADYGDGSGWVDVTAESGEWQYALTGNPAHWSHHTYSAPGTYALNLRVTYWDGEIVYCDPMQLVKFEVTE